MIVLASASPRRREMLERVGVAIEVIPADIDETPRDREDPEAYVARIAAAKAAAISSRLPGRWVLAADTTVTVAGEILAKAADGAEATQMLEKLSGRTHQVITGFAIAGPKQQLSTVTSDVDVVPLSPQTIADYVASNEWRGKAGAYAIQGIAAAFIRSMRGSVTNIIGLPLAEVLEALESLGAARAQLANGIAS
ncbi:MAG TPA: Maf family protein [Kofleriaceae bacterium]